MLHIAGINYDSLTDGEGVRAAIFFSGCPHHCPGCHNQEAQAPHFGTPVTFELVKQIAEEIKKRPYLKGITFTGGDPFYNPCETLYFLMDLRECMDTSHLDLWIYTGYTLEELRPMMVSECMMASEYRLQPLSYLIQEADVLVDGPFVQELADKSLQFRGSSNQRIIDLNKTRENHGSVVLWNSSESW